MINKTLMKLFNNHEKIAEKLNIDLTCRPSELSAETYYKLTNSNKFGIELGEAFHNVQSMRLINFAVPSNNYNILVDGNIVGEVTSGTQSPTLNKGIGIGYIHIDHSSPGTEVSIDIRSMEKSAVIVSPPFYKYGTVNNAIEGK